MRRAQRKTPKTAIRAIPANGARVTVEVTQPVSSSRARGTVHVVAAPGVQAIDAVDLGVLQTATAWATITGVARTPGGAARPFTAIVELADPFVAGRPRTVSIAVQGQPVVSGVLK